MNAVMIFLSFFISFNTLAKNIELQVDAKFIKNGIEKNSSKKIIARLDKEFIVPMEDNDDLKFKMVLTQDPEKTLKISPEADPESVILLSSKVFELDKGKEKLVSSPEVLTVFGKKATITMQADGDYFFEMNIYPKEI